MLRTVLHDENNSKWIMFGRDPEKNSHVIDTNEYLVSSGNESILLDPGGIEIFPSVLTSVSETVDIKNIKAYLCSHQDPDIMSSLPLWLGITPDAKIYLSWLWSGFISHFGCEYFKNFEHLADEGATIELGSNKYEFIPAHYCHSSGNFHFYDPTAKILFTGDMGAALVPVNYPIIVEDFKEHIKYMEKFHQRWMPSNKAKNKWVNRVRKLNPKILCPQHGSVFMGENVKNFLDWIEGLEVGIAK
ncbi:MBL fold metallo-hydrolase [Fluviispira sanaruensis]|uniref:MBL fold metallo-hydrolase n=1 Tax=Fluviispira sanaruensis TaxID=2493639 RepID=A0A4P2VIS1_FLUSA|nr:MBL fold metallo-hydrolase [Fluviispira sanaruensis]BBH52348.1 MBL fold metallo-hydrolase [Fluviispira sanaruensis]